MTLNGADIEVKGFIVLKVCYYCSCIVRMEIRYDRAKDGCLGCMRSPASCNGKSLVFGNEK